MQSIIPALLTLHIFGVVFWMGGTLVQYIFLLQGYTGGNRDQLRYSVKLTQKIYTLMIWHGMALVVLSGLTLLLLFGLEWLRPRGFVHFKIVIAMILVIITVIGRKKFAFIRKLAERENPDPEDEVRLNEVLKTWRILIITGLTGLGCVVVLGIFKFGF